MIVYHAGLSVIKKFEIGSNGVHFGGLMSAYEAALRKCDQEGKDIFFVHQCKLRFERMLVSDDLGCHEEWAYAIQDAIKNNVDVIKYVNKYEPDLSPSFILLNERCISSVSCSSVKSEDAEKMLLTFCEF